MNEFLKQFIAVIVYSVLSLVLVFSMGGLGIVVFVIISLIHSLLLLIRVITIAIKHDKELKVNLVAFAFVFIVFLISTAWMLRLIGQSIASSF